MQRFVIVSILLHQHTHIINGEDCFVFSPMLNTRPMPISCTNHACENTTRRNFFVVGDVDVLNCVPCTVNLFSLTSFRQSSERVDYRLFLCI